MGSEKLTEGQRDVLAFLANRNNDRDGALSAPEISKALGHRARYWAASRLGALEVRGFAARLGVTFTNAQTWTITEEGRCALAPEIKEANRGEG